MSSFVGYLEQTRASAKEIENPFSNSNNDGYVGTINLTGKSIAGGCETAMGSMLSKANEVRDKSSGLTREEIKQQLEAEAKKVKTEIGSHVDKSTDDMVNHISNLPANQQFGAMRAWTGVLGRITSAVAKAMDYVRKAIAAVLGWVKDMWTQVKLWLSQAKEAFSNIFS